MQTSGFFYLQSFDTATQKYVESNNYFSFAKFLNDSGISTPISYIQVGMTGVTGLGPGQTPFTGITGYYTAIDANPFLTIETVNYRSETPNISGLRFFCPVSLKKLEMEYIDIGNSNIISGYVTGINIGSQNYIYAKNQSGFYTTVVLTGITGTAPNQTPFTGVTGYENILIGVVPKDRNFNLGYFNSITNTNLGNNFGSDNSINSGYNLFQIGSNLSSLGIENSTLIGSANSIISGSNILVIGNNNTTEDSSYVGLLGRGNYLNNYTANIIGDQNDLSKGFDGSANILGNSNTIENCNDLNILGNSNYFSGTTSCFVVGANNYSESKSGDSNNNIFILGNDSTAIESSEQIIFGNSISSTNSLNNTLFGKNISSIGNGNISFGADNTINSNNESIYGASNVSQDSNFNFIAGKNNSLSGAVSNTIIGSNNNSDSSAFTLFISGITITGSIAESKYNQIYMTGAQATGFFNNLDFAYAPSFATATFNGLYTTTDFSGYTRTLGSDFDEYGPAYAKIVYDPQDSPVYNCFKSTYGYNQKAWVLFCTPPGYDNSFYPVYTCVNLRSGNSLWSGLQQLYTEGTCLPSETPSNYSLKPDPTGRLTGYLADNVDGFYTRTKADQNFTNIKGNTINFDQDGPALYYNNKNTGNLYSLERIYLTSGGTENFSRWTGLKSYNSGKAFATGTSFTVYRENLGGGDDNFYLGNENKATFNSSSFVFGSTNTLLDNSSSYVFGRDNYLENTFTSYVFGDTNSSLGDQNYIIGNNNEVRSGDYNSIFIGINHTPTGSNKVATICLASVDNRIEINPSEIRLDSINRPKINGENIIIQSEFDTIANSLTENGPTFTTNTFQDRYYDKLADKVFLSSFTYDSGASTSLTSYAQEFSATSTLFLNKFNIFSTISYTGVSGFNVIYGNHTVSQFSPAWLVVDSSTSGVYYKNDITPFNLTPQSGWYATGFRDNGLLYTGTSVNFEIDLVMGSRQGYMSVNTASFGTMYVPFFY